MKKTLSAAILIIASSVMSPLYAADKDDVLSTVSRFIDDANAQDVSGVRAVVSADGFVADDLPPYSWEGRDAFINWLAVVGAQLKQGGVTSAKMVLGHSKYTEVTGDSAYAPVPAHFVVQAGGHTMDSEGLLIFTLTREGGNWRIRSMAWARTK
jgi:hypothetical protein